MYNILYLNQSKGIGSEVHYQNLINAHCFARLCHDVLYISDGSEDAHSFLEGPRYTIDELFDNSLSKKESSFQPSLDIHIVDIIREQDTFKDILDSIGIFDYIIHNGDPQWATIAQRIASNYHAYLININDFRFAPVVNEIQLKHILRNERTAQQRIITASENIYWMDIEAMKQLIEKIGISGYMIGKYVGHISLSHSNMGNIRLITHTTCKNSMMAIYQSLLYIQMPFNNRIQGAIDALALGVPVLDISGNDLLAEYGVLNNIDDALYLIRKNLNNVPNKGFSFGSRMCRLENMLDSVRTYGTKISSRAST